MADISLTASMRSNLLSLQNTQSLMDVTQERLRSEEHTSELQSLLYGSVFDQPG